MYHLIMSEWNILNSHEKPVTTVLPQEHASVAAAQEALDSEVHALRTQHVCGVAYNTSKTQCLIGYGHTSRLYRIVEDVP